MNALPYFRYFADPGLPGIIDETENDSLSFFRLKSMKANHNTMEDGIEQYMCTGLLVVTIILYCA